MTNRGAETPAVVDRRSGAGHHDLGAMLDLYDELGQDQDDIKRLEGGES
jgi:hypothetical protein